MGAELREEVENKYSAERVLIAETQIPSPGNMTYGQLQEFLLIDFIEYILILKLLQTSYNNNNGMC